ncbi:MAG: hypothetical protein K6E59_04745 [Bacilli bacterium]|nr:hypothetical protein [Bacilli bacterium]
MGRTVKINIIPEEIGPFVRHHGENPTMEYGFYYEWKTTLPFASDERMIRVWLPGTYDFSDPKRYPVLYMADGQNLVDEELTAYGDWHLDRVIRDLMQEGYPEPILVGIDCPKDPQQRMDELNPPYPVKYFRRKEKPKHPIGDQFINYIVDELKPMIDSLFPTDPRKEATGIGGSSMGGIMAFYGFLAYPNTFGYSHSFSPPFFFYSKRFLRKLLHIHQPNPETHGRVYLYVGGTKNERRFTRKVFYMRDLLEKYGYGTGTMEFDYDKQAIHHEEWWYKHSYPALRFWLGNIPKE